MVIISFHIYSTRTFKTLRYQFSSVANLRWLENSLQPNKTDQEKSLKPSIKLRDSFYGYMLLIFPQYAVILRFWAAFALH